ncbi:hypothetical protein LUZ60_013873 [Juncus effusus]|nr:hypothetical protein LUZ60_013873 [Juncus effusus]
MEVFYSQLLIQQQQLLQDLLSVPQDRPDLHIPLISRALSYYVEYYHHKSQLADRDIFQVFSPYWLTPLERSFLWLRGVRPCVIFRLIPTDLTDDQKRQVGELREVIVEREWELERRMRMVEEATTVLLALTAVHGAHRNGETRAEATERVTELMRIVYKEADGLRRRLVTRIMQILSTAQTVRFLAGAA